MIARMWHGWADQSKAADYELHFNEEVQPTLRGVSGCHGAYLLRRDDADGVELVTIALFDSLADVRGFAGDDYEHAVVAPAAQAALRDYERAVRHYEIVATPE
jgi:Antibiotic biosynthesis monooxygenase